MTSATIAPSRAGLPSSPLRIGPTVPPPAFAAVRRRMLLEGCKWDPQVGDVATLAPFPLLLSAEAWAELASLAERLAAELVAAEREIARQPALLRHLGMPRRLRRWMATLARLESRDAARVIRFDFHPTADGWRISEANADVPGGYGEASLFPRLMAEATGVGQPVGNPGDALADAIAQTAGVGDVVLLSAVGFMEDHQVVAYLGRRVAERGLNVRLGDPSLLAWKEGQAMLRDTDRPAATVVRFVQAEWIARMARRIGGHHLFAGGATPVINGPFSAIGESKRLPLVFDAIRTPMPTWRRLLPETRDPRRAPWGASDGWLLKSAYCNTGDDVAARGAVSERRWRRVARQARLQPWRWLAQRRFEPLWLETPLGRANVCLGVYTVNGNAAGIYGRLSTGAFVDYRATDVAVLVSGSRLQEAA